MTLETVTCKYNIKMDVKEIGLQGVDWIHMAQYKVQWRAHVKTVIDLLVP
jgi:hypothetical protein